MNVFRIYSYFYFLSMFRGFVYAANRTHAATLMTSLLTGYDTFIRPFYDRRINISVGFFLFSIQDLDEKSGTLTSVGGPYFFWDDPRLTWDPSDYEDLNSLLLRTTQIWYPDLYLLNPANKMEPIGDSSFILRLTPNGTVWRYLSSIIKTSCDVDMTYFPFDTQECYIKLTAWGYLEDEMYLKALQSSVDMTYYDENAQWRVVGAKVEQHSVKEYDGLVAVVLSLKRKPEYYAVNIIAPIFMLCILNPLVFLLPTESGERISYTITIFLSLAVFMTLISDNMPKSSEPMARLSYILLTTMTYSTTLCVASIFIMRVHFRSSEQTIPNWTYTMIFILQLRWLYCSRKKKQVSDNSEENHVSKKAKIAFPEENDRLKLKEQYSNWEKIASAYDGICFFYSCLFLVILIIAMFLSLFV